MTKVSEVWPILEQYVLADGMPIVCDLSKSHGSYLYDAKTNTEFLDFFGFFAARPVGFNHPGLHDAAFSARLDEVSRHKLANCDVYTTHYARFVKNFCETALQGAFKHLFLIEGGGPAVENALKTAFDWKHRKNIAAGRGDKGNQILYFSRAFHGRTGYALSITDPFDRRKVDYFPRFKWPKVEAPRMGFPFDDAAKRDVEQREKQALAEIHRVLDEANHEIAAIIIEPIQGEGGDNYFRSEFLRALRMICDEREVILIFDEIQTGFGATGRWWDWMNHDVKPDLMVFGKKTQVCGFAATDRIDDVDSVFKIPSRISSTFGGDLVDMVRCDRVIDIVVEERLLDNAATMGAYLVDVLGELADEHAQITGVRGRGLWTAFDMPSIDERNRLIDACFELKLLILPCGERSIRLRPALDVTADAVGRAGAQLDAALGHM